MKVTIMSKVKLNTGKSDDEAFSRTACAYTAACNEVSAYAFENDAMTQKNRLHDAKYRDVRIDHGLKAQMACSVMKTVSAKYKTVKENLKQNPFVMKEDGKTYRCRRSLDWLTGPVVFRKEFIELVRDRDFSITSDGEMSVSTLDGRLHVPFQSHNMEQLVKDGWHMGGAVLFKRKGTWYMHIAFSKEFDDDVRFSSIVGIDRGLRFLMTTYDGKETVFYDGKDVARIRNKFARTRASLQAKGTKGAKRTLKRISGRENRWMADVDHCLSKTLVSKYGPGTLFVLEDLTNVSFSEKNLHGKKQSRCLRSWSFYDLEQKLIYKAKMNGCDVVKVPPKNTSRRCPVCGHTDKSNRDHKRHELRCPECGYSTNDDRAAAMNIRQLGEEYLKTGELKGFPGH